MPNKRVISGKVVCLLGSIKVRRQTLPEINVHARLFGTLEYKNLNVLLVFEGLKDRKQQVNILMPKTSIF